MIYPVNIMIENSDGSGVVQNFPLLVSAINKEEALKQVQGNVRVHSGVFVKDIQIGPPALATGTIEINLKKDPLRN